MNVDGELVASIIALLGVALYIAEVYFNIGILNRFLQDDI